MNWRGTVINIGEIMRYIKEDSQVCGGEFYGISQVCGSS